MVACVLCGLLIAGAASALTRPSYRAETQLFTAIQNSGTVAELQQGNTFSQGRVQSYVRTATTPAVLQPVIDELGLTATPQSLAATITAEVEPNTVLINITAVDDSPQQAAATAQAVGSSLIRVINELERPASDGLSPVKLSIVKPAIPPTSPSGPNTKLNLGLGLLMGLIVGVGTAILRSALDTRVRGEADLKRVTDLPILGGISFTVDAASRPLITQAAPQGPRAESFRQLRTNLQFAQVSHGPKATLVTSSVPGEGKTTTAVNLALAIAESGQSVVLIDADLRRPTVGDYLGLEKASGLTTALIGEAHVDDLLQPWGDQRLYVLTSGQIPPNPSELLGSEAMEQLIQHLESNFDAVVIDAPPLLPVTDAAVLSSAVGGVILVAGMQMVRQAELQKSIHGLELVGADVLGMVLNRLPAKGPDAYSYGGYTYEPKVDGPNIRTGSDSPTITSSLAGSLDRVLVGDVRVAKAYPARRRSDF